MICRSCKKGSFDINNLSLYKMTYFFSILLLKVQGRIILSLSSRIEINYERRWQSQSYTCHTMVNKWQSLKFLHQKQVPHITKCSIQHTVKIWELQTLSKKTKILDTCRYMSCYKRTIDSHGHSSSKVLLDRLLIKPNVAPSKL